MQGFPKTEFEKPWLVSGQGFIDQNVLGLDTAMNDPALVNRRERTEKSSNVVPQLGAIGRVVAARSRRFAGRDLCASPG